MNTQTQEALKMEANRCADYWANHYDRKSKGDMELLRKHVFEQFQKVAKEALEQPAQEPVAYGCKAIGGEMDGKIYDAWYDKSGLDDKEKDFEIVALYTSPPAREWQGLSDDGVYNIWNKNWKDGDTHLEFARAIEQALRNKNANNA
jgi:hypothetical protein